MSDRQGSSFFTGLILGALAGAGLYHYLTSTEEGRKIKNQLRQKGKEALEDLKILITEIETRGEEFKIKAKEVQAQLQAEAKNLEGQLASEAQEKLTRVEELRDRGRKAITYFTRNGKTLN